MKSGALVAILNTPESTIRKYAADYAEFLSPTASAAGGRHRDYSDHDARVLKLVIDMKAAKQDGGSIDATLKALQDSSWERLPQLDEKSLAVIPTPAALLAAQTERAVMQKEIDMLREQVIDLKAERADRDVLVKKLAEAETMLRLYEDGRLKPKE